MGISISEMFSASSRQAKKGVRERIFFEHQNASVRFTIVFAILGAFLWGADWSIDPEHVEKAAIFRFACLLVLLLSALVKWLSKSLYINYAAAYLSMAICEAGLIKLLDGLNGGLTQGAGQFLYFFLGTLLFCTHFPFNFNLAGCLGLAIVPHVVGEMLAANFPHLLFASILWPASALTIILLLRARMLLVEKQKLLRDLESSGVTDPITGLPNARGLGKSFQRMIKLTMAKPSQNFLLLMEVDGFDKIKSTLGQGFANFLMAKIGEIIEVSFRDRDIIASTNSNEFACILPNLSQDKALDIAERFRTLIERTSFDCPATENGKFSCTVSIAIVSAEIKEEIKTLLNRARIGINQAKSSGGNQSLCI